MIEHLLSAHLQWPALLALILTAAAVMGSPGPSTMSVTAVGAAFGIRPALPYLGGVILGTVGVLLAVATGVFTALLAVPFAATVLLGASAAYILVLAVRIATAPPLGRHEVGLAPPSFAGGALLAIANPKAYAAIAAVFAHGAVIQGAPTQDAALKVAVLAAMIVVIHVFWLLTGTSCARILRHPIGSRIANLLFAAILVVTTAMAVFG